MTFEGRGLEEQGLGFKVGLGVVPVVAAAALFGLTMGRPDMGTGPEAGYAAGQAADHGPVVKASAGKAIITRWWPGLATYQSCSRLTTWPSCSQSTSGQIFQPKDASGTPVLAFCNPWLQRFPPKEPVFIITTRRFSQARQSVPLRLRL
jgi:hypothetical protein